MPAAALLDKPSLRDGYDAIVQSLNGGGACQPVVAAANNFRRSVEDLQEIFASLADLSKLLDEHFAPGTALANSFCTVRQWRM